MESDDRKYSLLRLVINAGLEEDLIEWLNKKGYHDFYGRLDNIPSKLIEEYVSLKKLLIEDNDAELLKEINSIDYEETHGKGYIRAKRNLSP